MGSTSVQCLDQVYEQVLRLLVDIHKLNTPAGGQEIALRLVAHASDYDFGAESFIGPIK